MINVYLFLCDECVSAEFHDELLSAWFKLKIVALWLGKNGFAEEDVAKSWISSDLELLF